MGGKQNDKKGSITTTLDVGTVEKIDHLVNDTGDFKSRDDFIEHACHEFMVRRNLLLVSY